MNKEYNKLMLYKPKEDIVKDYLILEHNWNELKKYVEDEIKHLEKSRYVSFNEYGENKLRIFKDFLFKIKKLEEGGNNE